MLEWPSKRASLSASSARMLCPSSITREATLTENEACAPSRSFPWERRARRTTKWSSCFRSRKPRFAPVNSIAASSTPSRSRSSSWRALMRSFSSIRRVSAADLATGLLDRPRGLAPERALEDRLQRLVLRRPAVLGGEVDDEPRLADLDPVAARQEVVEDQRAVHEGAVPRTEVGHPPPVLPEVEAAVPAAEGPVHHRDPGPGVPAHDDPRRLDVVDALVLARASHEEAEGGVCHGRDASKRLATGERALNGTARPRRPPGRPPRSGGPWSRAGPGGRRRLRPPGPPPR